MNNKYFESIHLYGLVLEVAKDEKLATSRADELFGYMAANFVTPMDSPENQSVVNRIILSPDKELPVGDFVNVIPEGLWPVFVVKRLFVLGALLDPTKMNNFMWFLNTYGKMITVAFRKVPESNTTSGMNRNVQGNMNYNDYFGVTKK